jgi:hypothetical protein
MEARSRAPLKIMGRRAAIEHGHSLGRPAESEA